MSKKVVIAGACRTAIGKMGGGLSTTPATELGSIVIKEALKRANVPADQVDEVIMGCVIQASQGQNVARQCSIKAGIPVEVPAVTINVVCGSGLNAINMAAEMIKSGDADIVVAGGTENMSMAPFALEKGRFGYRMNNGVLVDTMIKDALEFAASSQQKAVQAQENGWFDSQIVPVEVKQKKKTVIFDKDEGPRPGTTAESLAGLRPINKDGVVTAGNASGINDGAAAVVVMSEEKAKELGVKAQVEWLGGCLGGVDPRIMGVGPVAATRKLFKRLDMTIDDIDCIEANEAFAAQSVAVAKELNFPAEKLNLTGGAIALGHPVGASGCRIFVTLLANMERTGAKTGLATLCIGGGMGCSLIVKALD